MNILIIDDDVDSAYVLQKTLTAGGHTAIMVHDGNDALAKLRKEPFDTLLVDWMLPGMDGIELIRWTRQNVSPTPLMIMLTAISDPKARAHAMKAGADDYIAKPYDPVEVIRKLTENLSRRTQTPPPVPHIEVIPPPSLPPFVAIAVAASTGGPLALREVLQSIPDSVRSYTSIFLVLHAPDWMLDSLPTYLKNCTKYTMCLAKDRMPAAPGHLYIAPFGKHMVVNPKPFEIRLKDGPKENFVRPSADPLFRSISATFGRHSLGVILTGMGCDGAAGAAHMKAGGATILVQDPETAIAPSMPTAAIEGGVASQVPALEEIGALIGEEASRLHVRLGGQRQRKTQP